MPPDLFEVQLSDTEENENSIQETHVDNLRDNAVIEEENPLDQEFFANELDSNVFSPSYDQPSQPRLANFPQTQLYGRLRSFKPKWYEIHRWISYWEESECVTCFACDKFGVAGKERFKFKIWSTPQKLDKHANSLSHQNAMIRWIQSKAKDLRQTSVANQLARQKSEDVKETRLYLETIINTLAFLAKQNIPIRGDNEDRHHLGEDSNLNRGNFLELLSEKAKDASWLKDKFHLLMNRHKQWTSPDIQNELLMIIADEVLLNITDNVKKSSCLSVIADETMDISRDEQFSIYIRFISKGKIQEKFLGFYIPKSTSGQDLFDLLCSVLRKHGIDLKKVYGQAYDGASNMSGCHCGVATLMLQVSPKSIYIHCYRHLLNLAIQKSVTDILKIRQCLGDIQAMSWQKGMDFFMRFTVLTF